jgi:hypothetical protein
MNLTRIQRLNIDSTNFEYDNTSVSLRVALPNPIVKVPESYNVVLEKAEIPIGNIPLNVLSEPHYIAIDYPSSAPDHPVLEKKLNIFWIQDEYRSINEFVAKVNKIINDDLLPSVSCGTFSYNSTDLRLEYKFGDSVHRDTLAMGVEMWFDHRLKYLLDGIPGLVSGEEDPTMTAENTRFHKVTWNTFLAGAAGTVIKPQDSYLIPRLFGFKSIRITSSLPTRPYITFDQASGKSVSSNLLAEVMLDSQNYTEGELTSFMSQRTSSSTS